MTSNEDERVKKPFNPNEHITKLPQGNKPPSDYLEVKWRLVWFRDTNKVGTILTEIIEHNPEQETTATKLVWNDQTKRKEQVKITSQGWAMFRAIVTDDEGATAVGHGSEGKADFLDYVEKAETKAVGRALAMLGYGTQFTGDELAEGDRIVDAPVQRPQAEAKFDKEPEPKFVAPKTNGRVAANENQATLLTGRLKVPADWVPLLDFTKVKDGTTYGTSVGNRVINALLKAEKTDRNGYTANPDRFIQAAFEHEGLTVPVTGYALDPD